MAVSLKKPDKVDLSKPEISRKLPEYTPIHLIDEEETIKSLSEPPKAVDLEIIKPDEIPAPLMDETDIDLECSDRETHKIKIDFARIGFILSGFAVAVALVALIINILCVSIDIDAAPDEVSLSIDFIFSTVSDCFNWLLNSPLFMLLLGLSMFGLLIRTVRNITKF